MRRVPMFGLSLLLGTSPACADDKKDAVRVACVGDSITYGAGVSNRDRNCYPAVLQRLLGDGHDVRNFGVSGTTVLAKGDNPYTLQKVYQQAREFKPHVVVIALGTNDTKPQNWKHADG